MANEQAQEQRTTDHPFGDPRRTFADKQKLVDDGTIFDVLQVEKIPGYRNEGEAWAVTVQTRDNRKLTIAMPENAEGRDAAMEAAIAYIAKNGKVPNCTLGIGKRSGAFFINHALV